MGAHPHTCANPRSQVLQQFVNSNKQMRWCPGPGCTKIIMAGDGVQNVKCDPGGCGAAFCFRCGEEAHAPSACDELRKWKEKGCKCIEKRQFAPDGDTGVSFLPTPASCVPDGSDTEEDDSF